MNKALFDKDPTKITNTLQEIIGGQKTIGVLRTSSVADNDEGIVSKREFGGGATIQALCHKKHMIEHGFKHF